MDYTASQLRAIQTIDDNLQIIACAGSGKTQVISARVVEILARGAPPASVVAFTFTEKAAGELKDRIERLARERLGTSQGLGEMFVGTIHGYCLSLLQASPLYKFLKYSVLDDVTQRLLIDRNSVKCGLTGTPLLNGGGTLQRWKDSRLYQQLISIYREGDVNRALVPEAVHAAVAQYEELLHEKRYLDYTMIMSEAVQELERNEGLRRRIGEQVRYVTVDEYQDVNPLQERLVRQLYELGANVCVVGDDDQTIYQWRGSDVQNIITFAERYPNVVQIRLNENFRSSEGVISTARDVIANNEPDRLPKRMEDAGMQPFEYGSILARDFSNPQEEARWIAGKIGELHGTAYQDRPGAEARGLAYSDFAILLRSVKNDAEPITEALEAAGIPYIVTGMNRLFETPEVRAIRDVFYWLGDFAPPGEQPLDADGVMESLRGAGWGLSAGQLASGRRFLEERKRQISINRTAAELYLQTMYLSLLEVLELREEGIPTQRGRTGEIVFYNLGTFSQVIADYEQIHFHTDPVGLYQGFASFLHYQAPDYYPEGWEEHGLAEIDAVEVLTVHRAKGKQWPAVFVPALRKNRFPAKVHGGRTVWHVLPEAAVANAQRYKGTEEDERRLFYVAITRAERYLFCSRSPVPGNKLYNKPSMFLQEMTSNGFVLAYDQYVPIWPAQMEPRPRRSETTLALSFSELKYFFECPYSFKIRFLYGFNPPVNRALGYGKSLHNALAEIHAESKGGRIPTVRDVPRLVEEHLHLPFANAEVRALLEGTAQQSLGTYLRKHGGELDKLEHVEKNVELKLGDGIVVNGRIDLIRRTDRDDWVVVDFKSRERVQAEDISRQQLQVYALGFEQLTGTRAKLIEVHNLDDGGVRRELVNPVLIGETLQRVEAAGRALRANEMPRLGSWCETCDGCDMAGICRRRVV